MSTTGRVQLILHKNFHAANSSFLLYRKTQIVNKTENVIKTRGDMIDMIKIIFFDESSAMSQIGRQPTSSTWVLKSDIMVFIHPTHSTTSLAALFFSLNKFETIYQIIF